MYPARVQRSGLGETRGGGPFHNFIAANHGTLGVRKKVILPWCNLKSAFLQKNKTKRPSQTLLLRRKSYEI
jgi:hypothetical protein